LLQQNLPLTELSCAVRELMPTFTCALTLIKAALDFARV
jgi:hypothetical protein